MRHYPLMQAVLNHLALLAEKHPQKANTAVARRAKLAAQLTLKPRAATTRKAA
jgi:hypothetical protein